jgi:dimeric dUTPase (all-alpha-NTP-PPase superfamily)
MRNNKRLLQLEVMLKLQDDLNTKVNPNWKLANNDWLRATWIECAELMDQVGYKWWKKQSPNVKQAQYEMIDNFHFLMSYLMILENKYQEDLELFGYFFKAIDSLEDGIESALEFKHEILSDNDPLLYVEKFAYQVLNEQRNAKRTSLHKKIKVSDQSELVGAFFDACISLDLSFDELYTMYISKNVLNIFRQDKGYKTGTYIKQWPSPIEYNSTVEDNVILEAFLDNPSTKEVLETRPEVFFEYLYKYLEDNYPGNK